ncbi:hemotin [Drosophila eugracilis]|uniref:hemotin n=1 Tax=Drosophila eugracilis TaxID=29029 RepID=UPI0007E689A7|nr:hemotin [Drosophila eugracilis]
MEISELLENFKSMELNLFLLIPFGVLVSMVLVCYCYHCYQCVRDRRRARIEDQKALLHLPLSRLSITPGYSIIALTKLTHSQSSAENY